MSTQNIDKWQTLFNVGSISGLIALIYSVFQSLRKRPRFKFDFSSKNVKPYKENNKCYCEFYFSGIIKNQSLDPNSISKIYLVVWKNNKHDSTLYFGAGNCKLTLSNTKEQVYLPILFTPRQALGIEISFNMIVTGTSHEKILKEFEPVFVGSKCMKNKHHYELALEDVNENLYDESGKLCNRELMNLYWTLPDSVRKINEGNYGTFIKHNLKILWSKAKFRWKIILQALGLWK